MKWNVWIALFAVIATAGCSRQEKAQVPLICHIGGTMRPVFDKLVAAYEAQSGQKIEINSGDSGELLANIELQAEGDLYVCHDPFLDLAMSKQLAVDGWTLAEIYPVIIVQKGNPKNIRTLKDFSRDDVQLALTDYENSTLGRQLPAIFGKAGMNLDALTKQKNIIIHRSGSHVANLVAMKSADAALVWEAVAFLRRDVLDSIPITENLPVRYVDAITSATGKSYLLAPVRVTICSLKCSKQPKEAAKFVQFVMSGPAQKILEEYSFGASDALRKQEYKNGQKLD